MTLKDVDIYFDVQTDSDGKGRALVSHRRADAVPGRMDQRDARLNAYEDAL